MLFERKSYRFCPQFQLYYPIVRQRNINICAKVQVVSQKPKEKQEVFV
jgi:hypothetical protein